MKLKKRLQKVGERCREYLWRISVGAVVMLAIILILPPLISLIRTHITMSQLNEEKARYEESIRKDSLLIEQLKNDEFLEQYARERYFMQRPNEQVFIVED